ncbi:hypothetical protein ACFOWA_06410 [Pedobacter lithocola]|uniref:Uncharacterized protein n=1 Tax=Pedobacter lithocola TaxID=1908239 RepID=A0ABV8P698_9SPHI
MAFYFSVALQQVNGNEAGLRLAAVCKNKNIYKQGVSKEENTPQF